jgi:copper(I)-binding protein
MENQKAYHIMFMKPKEPKKKSKEQKMKEVFIIKKKNKKTKAY